jgi:hypothetical protein
MSKLSALTNLPTLASDDLLEVVDVSDTTTMTGGGGTNKKVTALTLANQLSTIGNYVAASHTHSNATTSANGFMSSTDKTKLDGIASGAEVNVQVDWNEATTTSDAFIQNKPGVATTSANGFMSSTDKTKLDGIASGAEVNVQANWNEATTTSDAFIQNKPGVATTSLPGFMSSTDKTKLDGLSNYTHPTGDGNLHVPATSTTNAGKVLTAGSTAGSLSWTTPSVSLNSPAFIGIPTAPTATANTNTTQIATTAFVKTAVDSVSLGSNPTYIITSNVPTVAEGTAVTFTVTTTDYTATQLYWTTASTDVTPVNGTITLNGNSGTFITTAIADSTSEGVDTFTVQIRTGNITGTIVGTCSVNISDNPVVYTLTPNKNTVVEGQSVTFNVNATNTPGTVLYWVATDGSNQLIAPTSGPIPITNNTGSFTVTIHNDDIVEIGSYFTILLKLNSYTGPTLASSTINITDISTSNISWVKTQVPYNTNSITNGDIIDINANGDMVVVLAGMGTSSETDDSIKIHKLASDNSLVETFNLEEIYAKRCNSVSINAAGDMVAIGASYLLSNLYRWQVHVLRYTVNGWVYAYNLYSGLAGGEIAGDDAYTSKVFVSMNAAGNRVVATFRGNNDTRIVRVYQWDGNLTWSQLGSTITTTGAATADDSSTSISINAVGDRIAIGLRGLNIVRVYSLIGNTWTKLGQDIAGLANEFLGQSVSLNDAGNRVAVSSYVNIGVTRIYSLIGSAWTKLGQDIVGEESDDGSGWSVSMNGAGDRVAIGAPLNDGAGTDFGHMRVYSWDSVNWNRVGLDISGNAAMGRSVCLNSVGNKVFTLGRRSNTSSSGVDILIYDQQ